MPRELKARAERLAPKLSKIRRQIHMYPELGYQEKRTSKFVAETLRTTGIKVQTGVAQTGVVGFLEGGSAGRTVALRADMDALPITEQSNKPYKSRVDGVMHACGHDGNTTSVLGAAMLLAKDRDALKGNVKFFFQPSEEAPPGGALPMIKAGVLRKPKVDYVIGVHVDPSIPAGKIGLREGPMMASADDFTLSVLGTASHGAKPHLGVDAISLTAQVIQALQTIPSRITNPTHPIVVTIGTIKGGYRQNIIADRVDMEGTLRTLHKADRTKGRRMIEQLTKGITRAAGGDYEFDFRDGYPILKCDPRVISVVRRSTQEMFGKKSTVEIDEPSMGGEDFAYFVNEVPGMMFRLGTGNKAEGITHPWHHPKFDLDEKGLWVGAAVMARSVRMLLEEA